MPYSFSEKKSVIVLGRPGVRAGSVLSFLSIKLYFPPPGDLVAVLEEPRTRKNTKCT